MLLRLRWWAGRPEPTGAGSFLVCSALLSHVAAQHRNTSWGEEEEEEGTRRVAGGAAEFAAAPSSGGSGDRLDETAAVQTREKLKLKYRTHPAGVDPIPTWY